jgi:hypothetical protein
MDMRDSRKPFGVGGLWENWKDPATGEWIRTFAGSRDRCERIGGADTQSDAADPGAWRLCPLAERRT